MTRRVPIRVRLAVAFAVLAALILALGMAVVYEIEQAEVRHALGSEAQNTAESLATVAGARVPHPSGSGPSAPTGSGGGADGESTDEGGGATPAAGTHRTTAITPRQARIPTKALQRYLERRSGEGELLLVIRDRKLLSNVPAAAALRAAPHPRAGGVRTVSVAGEEYVLAADRTGNQLILAALPMATVNAEVARLGRTALVVTLIGIVAAALLAWIMARRALRPLERIADRSARITSGDLSVRMGDSGSRDEIAQVSAALDDMLDRLQAAFTAQKRFVQDASHELRTPLTIARGHLEVALIEGRTANGSVRPAVELALGELERMGRLVDSLLALARAEHGVGTRTRMPAGRLAELSLGRSRPLADRAWRLEVAAGETEVLVDADAVEQVLLNLLANAARHTADGGQIALSVRRVDGRVEFEVADDGEGIDPADLPTLFDRFSRADGARGRDSGGAGLGLAICRTIVEAHGGAIRAHSAPGRGATFVVSLPAAPGPAA